MTTESRAAFQVGVQVLVVRGDSSLLLARRRGGFGDGQWGLPGGRLEMGETIVDAARRELSEELGLVAESVRVVCVSDPSSENNHQLQIGVEVKRWNGSAVILEPEKCDAVEFFSVANLPSDLFVAASPIIRSYFSGSFYVPLTHATT